MSPLSPAAAGPPSLGAADVLGQVPGTSLSWGCPVPCRKLSIPGLYAFNASCVPTIVTANGVLRRCQVFFGGQSCRSREPLCPALSHFSYMSLFPSASSFI